MIRVKDWLSKGLILAAAALASVPISAQEKEGCRVPGVQSGREHKELSKIIAATWDEPLQEREHPAPALARLYGLSGIEERAFNWRRRATPWLAWEQLPKTRQRTRHDPPRFGVHEAYLEVGDGDIWHMLPMCGSDELYRVIFAENGSAAIYRYLEEHDAWEQRSSILIDAREDQTHVAYIIGKSAPIDASRKWTVIDRRGPHPNDDSIIIPEQREREYIDLSGLELHVGDDGRAKGDLIITTITYATPDQTIQSIPFEYIQNTRRQPPEPAVQTSVTSKQTRRPTPTEQAFPQESIVTTEQATQTTPVQTLHQNEESTPQDQQKASEQERNIGASSVERRVVVDTPAYVDRLERRITQKEHLFKEEVRFYRDTYRPIWGETSDYMREYHQRTRAIATTYAQLKNELSASAENHHAHNSAWLIDQLREHEIYDEAAKLTKGVCKANDQRIDAFAAPLLEHICEEYLAREKQEAERLTKKIDRQHAQSMQLLDTLHSRLIERFSNDTYRSDRP